MTRSGLSFKANVAVVANKVLAESKSYDPLNENDEETNEIGDEFFKKRMRCKLRPVVS